MCSTAVIACVLIPRFALLAASPGRRELLLRPCALAPQPGREQLVGEASGAAEASGIHPGMRLSEALARCPELVLVTPDPERTGSAWEEVMRRLEGIGAGVESERPGEAFFEAAGLQELWGGRLEGVLARARRAIGAPARCAAAPTRFCAYAAATRARSGDPSRYVIVPPGAARSFLAGLPLSLLRRRLESLPAASSASSPGAAGSLPDRPKTDFVTELERVGIRTLGKLAALPRDAVADRFGAAGLRALELAQGRDVPLRPRRAPEAPAEWLELPEAAAGGQLAHALSLLVGRVAAHPALRGRTLRRLRLSARLAAGGGWRAEVALREASADPERLRLALLPRLGGLPGPATCLGLAALDLGPPAHDQPSLVRDGRERRRERLTEAIRQVRAAGGRDAVLRVLDVDPRSRVPERRAMLVPFPEPEHE